MLDREAVTWGYRYLLEREPESEAVISAQSGFADYRALRHAFMASPEYRARNSEKQWLDKWVAAEVLGGERLLWLNLADRFVSFPALVDDYEPIETAVARALVQEGDTFVDIGANIGWFTLLASTRIGLNGRIHAFEPRPETAAYLARTIAINGLQDIVTLYKVGLSDGDGEMNLTWSPTKDNPGGSRLVHGELPEGSGGARVQLITLDGLDLAVCDVIKIDVEGAEYRAMLGARQTLRRHRPLILSELHATQLRDVSGVESQDYIDLMQREGYRCFSIDPATSGQPIEKLPEELAERLINVVFLPLERAAEVSSNLFPS